MTHGTRSCYQAGCRRLECRTAEAAYRQQLRRRHQRGLPILGQLVSASEAWARIRVLKQEHFTRQQITGWADPHDVRFRATSRIRFSTVLRLRAICQQYLIEDSELPNHFGQSSGETSENI